MTGSTPVREEILRKTKLDELPQLFKQGLPGV